MNQFKRILGFIWILLGPAVLGYLIYEASKKMSLPTSTSNDMLQWGIIIGIFVPIAFGFVIFGIYSIKGAYDLDE
ncbi:MAG: hypothetical protein K1X54_07870 [Flavobacteriales bacterium]|nr:hypothetical protein [Flavobacteriales bacterium]